MDTTADESTLEDKVLAELLTLRKTTQGMTVSTLARSPVVCALMGDGDPRVAYNAIKHALLASDEDLALEAATYSLGFSSASPTHLGRLDDFGTQYGYDQRQARRYSDRGVRQMARLVSSSWLATTLPELTLTVVQGGESELHCFINGKQQAHVKMRDPEVTAYQGEAQLAIQLPMEWNKADTWDKWWTREPLLLVPQGSAGLRLVWRGEAWPKFQLRIAGGLASNLVCQFQALGNTALLNIESSV